MLTLVTSNPKKYAPFAADLDRLNIALEPPRQSLPEVQSLNFIETLTAKAQAAAAMFERPTLVDDAGLVLEAYAPFPGPLTSTVLRSIGVAGLGRLLAGVSHRASMECHLGCWLNGALRQWSGVVPGRMELFRPVRDERMPLSDLFVPNAGDANSNAEPLLAHRAAALAALEKDAFALQLEMPRALVAPKVPAKSGYDCPFCLEFENDGSSIFSRAMGGRLASRIVYEDEHFIVMPPLGQFMEGGLLLLTREHIPSFAWLEQDRFEHLEKLARAIQRASVKHWGVSPLIFEHGAAPNWGKGACCVDHAHFNIFPAATPIHPELARRIGFSIGPLSELARLQNAEAGYLFVQENDGARRIYDGRNVPSQLIRRLITARLGMPGRWHWQDYLGQDEIIRTWQLLKGEIRL